MVEPGLDLHEWETRWQELQDAAAESPEEALPEIARFIEELLNERGYDLSEPVTAEGDDPEIIRDYFAAREVADADSPDPEDVADALESLGAIYTYIVEDRAPP